jgi:hypothetical protein
MKTRTPLLRSTSITALTVALALTVGCLEEQQTDVIVEREHAEEDGVAFELQGDALRAVLTTEDGFAVSPVINVAGSDTRIGYRYDAGLSLIVEARVFVDGEPGAWQAGTHTYQDEEANNGHIDIVAGAEAVQLRFPIAASELKALAVESFFYAPEPVNEEGDTAASNLEQTQALARSRIPASIYVSRADWGARSRSCGPTHSPNKLTVHHTDTPNDDNISMARRVRQIQNFHIDSRGWCDIAYHFLIGQDGKIYQGRNENIIGAHAANANQNNVGISFVGQYMTRTPTDGQLEAAAAVMRAMKAEYGITLNRTNVKGHRQVGTTSTSCPGDRLYGLLSDIIGRANGSAATPPTDEPAPTPPATPPATPPTTNGTGSYSDVANGTVAFDAVEALRDRGALWGCEPGMFCPQMELTRLDAAVMLATLFPGTDTAGAGTVNDVPSDSLQRVKEVIAQDIIPKCSTNSFCPNGTVSRAAMAVFLRRAMAVTNLNTGNNFADVPGDHWAHGSIERLFATGDIIGCSTSPRRFCPDDQITRADAAIITARGFGLIE